MNMNRIPVWMDCDTGTDDAVALLLIHASPELELMGISTVCGNTTQDKAYRNTRGVIGLMGATYPVYRGAVKPLLKELKIATAFHGENGLGNVELPDPEALPVQDGTAWDALPARSWTRWWRKRATAPGSWGPG